MQRIAAGGKKNYFMGTDFTYEDLEGDDLDDYNYNVLREEDLEGAPSYVIEALPASEEKARETSYSKRILWIQKDNFVTVKIEFYDRRDTLIKIQTNHEWENLQGTLWRPKKILMDNLKASHKTVSGTVERTLNQEIDDSTFTERYILSGSHTQ